MSSIYFISPANESVEAIIKDFTPPTVRLASKRKGPAYAEAHIFSTGMLQQALFEKLAASPAAPHVKALVETYLNFIAFESKAYHLGAEPAEFSRLFRQQPASATQTMVGGGPDVLQRMAEQIVGASVTMNELPQIRYQKQSFGGNALKLASLVQEAFDGYVGRNPAFKPTRDGTLLICDRTLDLLAPLLHEFTLQAMANDLLQIVDGTKYLYKYASASGEASREVTLDEGDRMWIALRHKHIAEVSKEIIAKFNQFISENKAAKSSTAAGAGGSAGGVTSLAELRETMNDLGEFHELKNIYSLHLSISQSCLNASDRRKLIDVARVEQNMAVGLDAEGEEVEEVWSDLAPLLALPQLTSQDKCRLVMLYLLTQADLSDDDRKALLEHAKLGKEDLDGLRQLSFLSTSCPGKPGQRKPAAYGKRGARKTLLDDDAPFEVSRYIPAVKIVLDDLAAGELSPEEFPFLKASNASTSTGSTAAAAAPVSLRSKQQTSSSLPSAGRSSSSGSLSCFILGGMTYSEMRSVYELASRHNRDFYIGADRVLTPESFLSLLRGS